jgi:hypothetical protein
MTATAYAHLGTDDRGRVIVVGTTTKMVEIVTDHVAYGSDAVEIHRSHPHWPMAATYSALAYYYDHREDVDKELANGLARVDAIIKAQPRMQPTRADFEALLHGRAGQVR